MSPYVFSFTLPRKPRGQYRSLSQRRRTLSFKRLSDLSIKACPAPVFPLNGSIPWQQVLCGPDTAGDRVSVIAVIQTHQLNSEPQASAHGRCLGKDPSTVCTTHSCRCPGAPCLCIPDTPQLAERSNERSCLALPV